MEWYCLPCLIASVTQRAKLNSECEKNLKVAKYYTKLHDCDYVYTSDFIELISRIYSITTPTPSAVPMPIHPNFPCQKIKIKILQLLENYIYIVWIEDPIQLTYFLEFEPGVGGSCCGTRGAAEHINFSKCQNWEINFSKCFA